MKNNIMFKKFTILTLLFILPMCAWSREPVDINIGGRFVLAGWNGENDSTGNTFESDAAQLGADLTLRYGKFFGGIGIIGGQFTFSGEAPDRPTRPNPASSSTKIKRGELNIIAGYHIIPQLSVFLDLQHINNEWDGENYKITYNGLGIGASSHLALTKEWILYGSIGIIPVNVKEGSNDIGHGRGGSLEFGGMYIVDTTTTVSVSIRGQGREFDYDTAPDQTHAIGGLQFRFNKSF